MRLGVLFLMLAAAAGFAVEYKIELTADRADAVYEVGQPITFSARILAGDAKTGFKALSGRKVTYALLGDGNPTVKGSFVSAEKPFVLKSGLKNPGWTYCMFTLWDETGKKPENRLDWRKKPVPVTGGIGALVAPEQLRPGMEEPKDFDAFWQQQRTELNKVPLKAKLTTAAVPKSWQDKYVCFDVKVDCAGGAPVSGYLVKPVNAKPKSLPAVVSFHGAGVGSAGKPNYGQALCFDVNAHGIENGREPAYYDALNKGRLRGYRSAGAGSRDTVYFKGMYLRVMRALDFIKAQPEWNGRVLVVRGGSQGGGQSIAAAALDPQVTLCVAGVPALSDHAGSLAKPARQPGWPRFYDARRGKPDPKVVTAAAYFDNIFFARRIKCETWISTGFIDNTCSPAGVYVVFANVAAKDKHLVTTPTAGHGAPMGKGNARIVEAVKAK